MDENEQPPTLRTVQGQGAPPTSGGAGLPPGPGVNPLAELVADLLAATGLVAPDKLSLARGRAGQAGSLAQALVDEGIASSDGIARTLAARYQLPLVDLARTEVQAEALRLLPAHVLERLVALPFALDGDRLRVAIADPANVHAIDELRIATRHQVELVVVTGSSPTTSPTTWPN